MPLSRLFGFTLLLLTACGTVPSGSGNPTIVVRLVERSNLIVGTSFGPVPTMTSTCADGSTPAVFAGLDRATITPVLIPERLGKATFAIDYAAPGGLHFIDAAISLTEAGVVSDVGGEEWPGEFYAASMDNGTEEVFELIITPLTDATSFATLSVTAVDTTQQVAELLLAIALDRRVCP